MEPNASTSRLNSILQKSQGAGGGSGAPIPGVAPDNQAKLDAIFNQTSEAPAPEPEKKTVAGFGKNVVKSGSELIGGIVEALTHPLKTAKNIGGLALGAGQKLVGYEGDASAKVDQIVDYYKTRYGKDIGNTLYTDPVGVLADLSTLIGGGGALLKAGSKVAGLSDVAKVSGAADTALRYGKVADKVAGAVDPLRMASKGASYISKETGLSTAALKAKEFTKGLFKSDDVAPVVRGSTVVAPKKTIRGKIDEMALNNSMDGQTQTILRKPLPGEKPAQTAARLEKEYEKYAKVEENYKIKGPGEDTALEVVGSEIGNAYKTVIDKRNELGTMLDKAKREATSLVDVAPASETLLKGMQKSGLIKTAKGWKIGKDGTNLTNREISQLKQAEKDLRKLSKNPTPQAITNFKQKLAKNIDFDKNPFGKGAKDSERIAGTIYHALDEGLNVKGKPDIQGIYALNKEYSRLTNLLKEGDKILGKRTLSGDFKHDASIAKASVKSLHAGGKKDFLKALGQEVKDDFIQKAMTAAQAMKDAGNYKQASLLEELATGITGANDRLRLDVGAGGIRPRAIITEGANKIIEKVAGRVAGSPKERTVRYIKQGAENVKTRMKNGKEKASKVPESKPGIISRGLREAGYSTKKGGSQIRTRNAVLNKALPEDEEY